MGAGNDSSFFSTVVVVVVVMRFRFRVPIGFLRFTFGDDEPLDLTASSMSDPKVTPASSSSWSSSSFVARNGEDRKSTGAELELAFAFALFAS